VCYLPQNKVKDLVIVANGQACSLLIDGHNSSDLQLAINIGSGRHVYIKVYAHKCIWLIAARAREKLYMHSLYVSALRPWEYADSSTSHKLGSESHSYFGWPHEFSGQEFRISLSTL